MLTDKEIDVLMNKLRKDAQDFLKQNFDMELEIPILPNGRLSRSLGRYIWRIGGEPLRIEIAKNTLINDYSIALDVLKHECIHYALHSKGIEHRDNTPTFISACKEHNVSYNDIKAKTKRAVFTCEKCGTLFYKTRRVKDRSYMHIHCGGDLLYIKHEYV